MRYFFRGKFGMICFSYFFVVFLMRWQSLTSVVMRFFPKKAGTWGLVLCSIFLIGCQKKTYVDPNTTGRADNQVILWTAHHAEALKNLAQEYSLQPLAQGKLLTVKEFPNDRVLHALLPHALSEGWGPDLLFTTGDYIAAHQQKFVPAVSTEGFSAGLFDQTFVRSASTSLVHEDQIYGIPLGIDTLAIAYNRDKILDKLPNRNVPADQWSELKRDVASLAEKRGADLSYGGLAMGDFSRNSHRLEVLEHLVWQLGGEIFDQNGTEALFAKSQARIDGQKKLVVPAALEFYRSFSDPRFKHYGWNSKLLKNATDTDHSLFLNNQVAMVFVSASEAADWQERLKKGRQKLKLEDIDISFFPSFKEESDSPRKVLARVWSLGVLKDSAQVGTAWDFLKFSVGKNQMIGWYENTHLPTPRVDLLKEQENSTRWNAFVRQAKFARAPQAPLARLEWQPVFLTAIESVLAFSGRDLEDSLLEKLKQAAEILTEYLRQRKELQF